MDFLEIRKKAKERARAREAEEAAARTREGAPAAAPPQEAAAPDTGPPRPPGGASPFTTWRPGAGAAPPFVAPEAPPALEPGATRRPEDFALVATSSGPSAGVEPQPRAERSVDPVAGPPAEPLEEFFYREDEAGPAVQNAEPQHGPREELPGKDEVMPGAKRAPRLAALSRRKR